MGLLLHLFFCVILAMTSLTCLAQDDNIKVYLDTHNAARGQVGVAPLAWNDTLVSFAQQFANKMKQTCVNIEKSGGPYGENTAAGYGAFTTIEAVSQWVNEKPNYDHNSNTCVKGTVCSHYTQVVWDETLYLGCASIVCGAGWPFVVCEYYPPGNIPGKWPY